MRPWIRKCRTIPLFGYFWLLLVFCISIQTANAKVYQFQSLQMGMPFEILIYSEELTEKELAPIAQSAFSEVSRLNQIFSNYEYDSEISKLNRTAGSKEWVNVSNELWEVLKLSQKYNWESDGLFDVTIGAAANLWRKSRRDQALPEKRLLDLVKKRVGQKYLKFHSDKKMVKLELPFMRIDLGGIAKGYALDAASERLVSSGCSSHIVKAGGDMVIGTPPGGINETDLGWKITLFPKEDVPKELIEFRNVYLSKCAVGTSGDINQFVEINGVRYSHIIDPRSCFGLVGSRRAVVIAENATVADTHATISCLLDKEKVIDWLKTKKLDAHVLRQKDGLVSALMTEDFWNKLQRVPSEDN